METVKIQISSLSISCQLVGIIVLTKDSEIPLADTVVLRGDQSCSLQVSVSFLGSNAIALLALTPTLRTDFYATPLGPGQPVALGSICSACQFHQPTYCPTLAIPHLGDAGLVVDRVYRLSALIRIGAAEQPALLCGLLESPIVQLYDQTP